MFAVRAFFFLRLSHRYPVWHSQALTDATLEVLPTYTFLLGSRTIGNIVSNMPPVKLVSAPLEMVSRLVPLSHSCFMDSMQSTFSKRLLASLALASFVRADYYIDDQNFASLLYSENPGGAKWGPFQEGGETLSISLANGMMMTVDASQCFNHT